MKDQSLVQNLMSLKNLPLSWNILHYDKIFKDCSGGNDKILKSDFLEIGKYSIVDQGKELIAGYSNEIRNLVNQKPPYIVFGDHTRIFKYIDFPFAMGADGIKVLKVINENKQYTKYLYYFLITLDIPNTGYNRHYKYLKDIQIPLPPLPTQQKIAAILDAADDYRQKTKTLITKYDQLAQSLFLDMFGDPVRNEKAWETKVLGNITLKIGSGATPSGGRESYQNEGISLIRSMNVYDNGFKYKDLAFLNNIQAEKLKNVKVKKNDVLFNITGASVCRSCIVPTQILPARVNQHVAILRPKIEVLSSIFLNRLLVSENTKKQLLGIGKQGGATREAITKDQLENFEIIVPPISHQNQFAERIQHIEAQKQQAQASMQKAKNLFNSLLQQAFKGELVS